MHNNSHSENLKQKQLSLITRIKNGEMELVAELWKLLKPLTMKFISRYYYQIERNGTRYYDLEDLKQECYTALLKSIDYYSPERGSFTNIYAWMISRETRNLRRCQTAISLNVPLTDDTDNSLSDLIPDNSSTDDFERAEHRVYVEAIRRALNKIAAEQLTDRQWKIIQLRFDNEYTMSHISELLNISESVVLNEIHRALKIFRHPKNMKQLIPFLSEPYNYTDQ